MVIKKLNFILFNMQMIRKLDYNWLINIISKTPHAQKYIYFLLWKFKNLFIEVDLILINL